MTVTVFIRYRIDPFKRTLFEEYAKRWLSIIPKAGGDLLGYWMPHEGTNNIAFALISFENLAAYEAYRARLRTPGSEAVANFNFAEDTNSFSARSARSCERLSPRRPARWRLTPRIAILACNRSNTTKERNHAGHPQRTSARHSARCTNPDASCCPIHGTSAARWRCSISASRRSHPPAPASAWSIGKSDNRVTLEDVLKHLTELCGAVDLPVNADFEGRLRA